MQDRLIIENFGPIRHADLRPRALTVFIGPQATGKSLAAQVLYFLRMLHELLVATPPDTSPAEVVSAALEWWLGTPLSTYAHPGMLLRWYPDAQDDTVVHEMRWIQKKLHINYTFQQRVRDIYDEQMVAFSSLENHIYIPAGRLFYSFIPPATYMRMVPRLRSQTPWPGYIANFFGVLGSTINELRFSRQVSSFIDDEEPLLYGKVDKLRSPRQISRFHMTDDEEQFLRQRIEALMKGQIRYGIETIELDIGQARVSVQSLASGQMELWPFCAIIEKQCIRRITLLLHISFEEPEAHLHPRAQSQIMEIIAFLARHKVDFVLTTHSPYILYAINNFLMAEKVQAAGGTLSDDAQWTALPPEMVAAYRFAADGQVHDIMDEDVGLIDTDELDQVADDLGAAFTSLQERLQASEEDL